MIPLVTLGRSSGRLERFSISSIILRRNLLGTVVRLSNDYSALDLWNSKVPAQMNQVDGTDRTRDGNEVDLVMPCEKDSHVPDGGVVQPDPNISCARAAISGVG